MTARRKITEEAEKKTDAEKPEANETSTDQDDGDDEGSSERKQLTQRMPEDLVEDVDKVADQLGMTRNAAINMFCRQQAQEMAEQLGLEDE